MKHLSILFKSIWLNIGSILSVIAIYYLLIVVDQGIDVVIQAGENLFPAFCTITGCVLWAVILWYSGRMLSYIKQQKKHDKNPVDMNAVDQKQRALIMYTTQLQKHMPRLIAYNCFVCLQAAIISLPTASPTLDGWWLVLFISLHNCFYFFLNAAIKKDVELWKRIVAIGFAALYSITIITFIVRWQDGNIEVGTNRHIFWLNIYMLVFFMLQCFAVIFFVKRRESIDRSRAKDDSYPQNSITKIMTFLKIREDFIGAEQWGFKLFTGFAMVAIFMYLSGIFSIYVSAFMGALAFALLAMGIIIGLSNIITMINIRTRINFFLFLYIWAFIMGGINDPYCVRTIAASPDFSYMKDRPSTDKYLNDWFLRRMDLMKTNRTYIKNPDKKFDIYIVLSDGGASRAGQWSSSVMCDLQDKSVAKDPNNSFKEHILCLAGASGGSVGNTAFYALLKADDEKGIKKYRKYSDSFFQKDFLTFTLGRLLGPDIFQYIIPLGLDNRADVLERSFSESPAEDNITPEYDTVIPHYYGRPLSKVYDFSGRLPLLFINTTQVDNSYPGVISPVIPKKDKLKWYRTDVLSLVDSLKKKDSRTDIRFSTAAVLSSRFPFVSPAGKIHDRYFVDGGYYDNSGAGTTLEFLKQLKAYLALKKGNPAYDRFTFHILHLTNSDTKKKASGRIHPLTNDLASPLLTVLKTSDTGTGFGDEVLREYFSENFNSDTLRSYINYSLYKTAVKKGEKEDMSFPMSWVISDYHLKRMKDTLAREHNSNKDKFEFMR
ncbi:hypothetical protein R1T16_14765 [Flavobacterium sp. DG1-102-2]|uniref:hypothetical protein n=1 Tax=Flavobacterium sp. DG1-102-2 TaxID=3081663 RepID=UPI0029493454|nr:hypothetical protein [Flavobacterium sp. DG1-102-2]MDV6169696.1 hypothetical protein [Flavobacterium sp. DG1-102-2]